jgi:hypothetical protein
MFNRHNTGWTPRLLEKHRQTADVVHGAWDEMEMIRI